MNINTDPNDFFWPLIIRGIGMGLLFIPLTTITIYDLNNRDIPQGTALTNMVRQLGGSFGIAIMTTYISVRSIFHIERLSENVSNYSSVTKERLDALSALFISKGDTFYNAETKAVASIKGTVVRQAMVLTYNDAFIIIGVFFLICLPLLLLFTVKKKKSESFANNLELHLAE